MLKRMFIFGVMALWFTGCQSSHMIQEEQYSENGVCIYTHRLEDGAAGLEVMTANNPDVFIEKQENGFEYYYASGEDHQYFLWLQDGDLVQLNVPYNVDIYKEDDIWRRKAGLNR